MKELLLNIWAFLDGNKILIGMLLYFLVDHVLPINVWYTDLIEIFAYCALFVGGTHKIIKGKDAIKEWNKRKGIIPPSRKLH